MSRQYVDHSNALIIERGYGRYDVQSAFDKDIFYLVKFWEAENRYSCRCPDGEKRNLQGCWHIAEVVRRYGDMRRKK